MHDRFAEHFDPVINSIYEAGSNSDRWIDVLAQLTALFDAAGTALHVGDTDCSGFGFGASHNFDPEALDVYARHYYAINPLNPPLTRQPNGAVIGDEMLVPRRIYRHSEFYNDYAVRYGLEGSATAVLERSNGQIACLGIVQHLRSEPYGPTELAFLKRVVPHLQRAIDLNRKLTAVMAQRDRFHAALDAMELGVLFLDTNGLLLHTNRAAEDLVRSGQGLRLRASRLAAVDANANARLQAAIKSASAVIDDRGGTLAIPRPGQKRPLLVRISPYLDGATEHAARVIVFVSDPNANSAGTIAEATLAYGLTRRETALVEKLVGDANLKTIAEEMSITEVTVRNHLARAMAKTGTNKQAELVSLILSTRLPVRR